MSIIVDMGQYPKVGEAVAIGAPDKVPMALYKNDGVVDTEDLIARGLMTREDADEAIAETEAIKKRMAPPGALGLPPLLEERRIKYGIVDEVFTHGGVATFERILVLTLPRFDSDKFSEHSALFMPAETARRERELAPRGIIVSAGVQALATLHTNGMEIGDVVNFMHGAPWSIPITWANSKEIRLFVMNVGDICSNEDLQKRMLAGDVRYEWNSERQLYELVTKTERCLPVNPRPDYIQ